MQALKAGKSRFLAQELIAVIQKDDRAKSKMLLDAGADVDGEIQCKKECLRPISAAFNRDNVEMMSLLLDYGADVDFEMVEGCLFVDSMIEYYRWQREDDSGIVKRIIYSSKRSKTEYIRKQSLKNISPATLAAKTGRINIYKDFIKRGQVFGPMDLYYISLGSGWEYSDMEKMAAIRMIRQGSMDYEFEESMEPVDCAVDKKDTSMLKLLLESGADPNKANAKSLGLFEGFNDIEYFKREKFLLLFKYGYDIKKHQVERFKSVLFFGCTQKRIEYIKEAFECFVDCGAEIEAAEIVFREHYSKGVPPQFKELWKFVRSLKNPRQMKLPLDV